MLDERTVHGRGFVPTCELRLYLLKHRGVRISRVALLALMGLLILDEFAITRLCSVIRIAS
jgi:hypothetical protein